GAAGFEPATPSPPDPPLRTKPLRRKENRRTDPAENYSKSSASHTRGHTTTDDVAVPAHRSLHDLSDLHDVAVEAWLRAVGPGAKPEENALGHHLRSRHRGWRHVVQRTPDCRLIWSISSEVVLRGALHMVTYSAPARVPAALALDARRCLRPPLRSDHQRPLHGGCVVAGRRDSRDQLLARAIEATAPPAQLGRVTGADPRRVRRA